MAAIHRNGLFRNMKPWSDDELELLNRYSVNLNGQLETRICFFHNQKQTQCLRKVSSQVQQEAHRPTVPVEDVNQRIFMDHYRKMRGDPKVSKSCILINLHYQVPPRAYVIENAQNLHNSYSQYNSDKNHITSWLAISAQRCGFALNFQTVEESSHTYKLKGRARILAKQAAKAERRSLAGTILVRDFLPMAQRITAFQKSFVQVPDSFVRMLDRTISLRKVVAFAQGNHGGTGTSHTSADYRSAMGHSFFTCTLEEVREALQPLISTAVREGTKTFKGTATEDNTPANLTNIFSILHVEEPSEAFQESTLRSAHRRNSQKPQKSYQAAAADDLEEDILGLICLLTDFVQIRTVVSETWMGYKTGLFDLVSASITTNTAWSWRVAWKKHNRSYLLVMESRDLRKVLYSYFSSVCGAQNQGPDSRESPGDELNFAMYNFADCL
ncbi:hypothetical protein AYL99_03301 [Fonsecaea erecta]|uniref:DUF6604 domain-containing protein n=1 Tax=Fonsecaea erecta TaxID=1367422 RepID=A0A178ZMR1_9EURO|nr:hypothetical protein AYL99_03301 [Fonsecaea erecta]OAP61100.1 hypothetical protein AYL99_03301 [Fonsecaea erecta]